MPVAIKLFLIHPVSPMTGPDYYQIAQWASKYKRSVLTSLLHRLE